MSSLDKEKSARALKILDVLRAVYPDARPLLNYRNPFELLAAVILSAQCTDVRVNQVTPALFAAYPTPQDLLRAPRESVEAIIRPTGFFHNKSRLLKEACLTLVQDFAGQVPGTMEELLKLKGVGRKTANVILGHCFGQPAVVVDTHCGRVSRRLGLTENSDPVKVERDLRALIPENRQTEFSDVINWHGRFRCLARVPRCPECEVESLCPFDGKTRA